MSLPQNLGPAPEPTPEPPAPEESPLGGTPGDTGALVEEEPETPEEVASDAALRSWAKENGIEDVPASGRLSAAWREQITAAMAAALDPKEEGSVDATPTDSSLLVETMKTETETSSSGEETSPSTEAPPVEYHSVFQAPNTFVSSQAYTA